MFLSIRVNSCADLCVPTDPLWDFRVRIGHQPPCRVVVGDLILLGLFVYVVLVLAFPSLYLNNPFKQFPEMPQWDTANVEIDPADGSPGPSKAPFLNLEQKYSLT